MRIGPVSFKADPCILRFEVSLLNPRAIRLSFFLLSTITTLLFFSTGCNRRQANTRIPLGIRRDGGHLNISLNVGLLNVGPSVLTRERVESHLQKVQRSFAEANPGDQLVLILDQPQSAQFVMEHASRRYRGPLSPGLLSAAGDSSLPFRSLRTQIADLSDYVVRFNNGRIFFLRSGLNRYAGGQVHYDLILLSDPILRDMDSAELCPLYGSTSDQEPLARLSDGTPEVFPSPGRSALDGLSVFSFLPLNEPGIDPVLVRALSVLINLRSPCPEGRAPGPDLHIPGWRRQLLLAAVADQGDAPLRIRPDECPKDRDFLSVQREMLHNYENFLRKDCQMKYNP